jgi:hypothetical protein
MRRPLTFAPAFIWPLSNVHRPSTKNIMVPTTSQLMAFVPSHSTNGIGLMQATKRQTDTVATNKLMGRLAYHGIPAPARQPRRRPCSRSPNWISA